MGAAIKNHALSSNAYRQAASASSFGAWLQGLSSGLSLVGDVNKVLDGILRSKSSNPTRALPAHLVDLQVARQEARTAEKRIRELESELARMRELVREDQLTGSLNRRGLEESFEREMARARRKHSPLCLALLDIDDFKKLNDTYGHCTGDAALIHLVRVVKNALRKMDVVARLGGEEFVILLPDTPLEDAMQTMARVQAKLAGRIFMHGDQPVPITFSAGVTPCNPGENRATLIARADEALYRAKKAGKNRVVSAA